MQSFLWLKERNLWMKPVSYLVKICGFHFGDKNKREKMTLWNKNNGVCGWVGEMGIVLEIRTKQWSFGKDQEIA